MNDPADRFVDLASLTYLDDESRDRRAEASALLAASPELVERSVHAAAAAGDIHALRLHLDREPACVELRGSPRNWVPLLALCYSRVAQRDAVGCVELLLARGADANARVMIGDNPFTALTGVCGEGEAGPFEQPAHPNATQMAERLLDAGASPNDTQAVYNTHFLPSNAWLALLLARGLSVDLDFLLGAAATQGFADRVGLLLAHNTSADGRNRYNGRTHVENAQLEGHTEIAQQLLAAGAQPPAFTDEERLCVAVLANDAAVAQRLVSTAPSANALAAAARHGRLDALCLGLSLGLPIDGCDAQGLTALHHAAWNGHLAIVRELVERGASLEIRDPIYNGTPRGHAEHATSRWPRPDGPAIIALLGAAMAH